MSPAFFIIDSEVVILAHAGILTQALYAYSYVFFIHWHSWAFRGS